MFSLGLIAFQTPLAFAALVALPVIWWLLRITPPRPVSIRFPPIRFLLDLRDKLNTPDKSPWWLTALRIVLAALLIIALAGPTLNPAGSTGTGNGPVLIVLDDGWAAARNWRARIDAIKNIAAQAARQRRAVILATTAPAHDQVKFQPETAAKLLNRLETLKPKPFRPDRKATLEALLAVSPPLSPAGLYWLADGLDYGHAPAFESALVKLAGTANAVTILRDAPGTTALVLTTPALKQGKLVLTIVRAGTRGAQDGMLRAVADNGRTLADIPFSIAAGKARTTASLDLPLALRNQVTRIEIPSEHSAAAVFLLDGRWRQKAIGIAAGADRGAAQPLLSALHYVTRALEVKAALKRARPKTGDSGIGELVKSGLSALILADIGKLQPADERLVTDWIKRGGMLIRFAGPRLARGNDTLVPVKLRRGDRALGGVLSWSKAQNLAQFDDRSPFFGLAVPKDVVINRQVLADPSGIAQAHVWARLMDGTPLVTAKSHGGGLIVLFHVSADPDWSNLPLSGLFVQMLHRLTELAPVTIGSGTGPATGARQIRQQLLARKTLDGFGRLGNPPPHVTPIPAREFDGTAIGPLHPPGLYGPANAARGLNIGAEKITLKPLEFVTSAPVEYYGPARAVDLKPVLLIIVFCLFLLDGLAVFALSGGLGTLAGLGSKTAAMVLALMLFDPPSASAQVEPGSVAEQFALAATQKTRLAFVLTGRAETDNISLAGLRGLSHELRRRTAFEPGSPVGVSLDRDELTFFPLIYWPISRDSAIPSPTALAKIDAYMKRGGTVLFDTRDHQSALPGLDGAIEGPASRRLRQMLAKLDIPPLEIIPANHVITKAFYLLQSFPGRWAGGRLWVEAASRKRGEAKTASKSHDGVTSIIIGSNDYASAWARDVDGRALYPVVPGGNIQREKAFRTGINIVIYVLTGNYKADQVHVPALLERLGQ